MHGHPRALPSLHRALFIDPNLGQLGCFSRLCGQTMLAHHTRIQGLSPGPSRHEDPALRVGPIYHGVPWRKNYGCSPNDNRNWTKHLANMCFRNRI